MSSTCLVHQQLHDGVKYAKLKELLTFFYQELQNNQKFDSYYKEIGIKRADMLISITVIIQYFQNVNELQKQQKISLLTCDQIFQGVTDYLQSEHYQSHSTSQKAVFLLEAEIKIASCIQAFNTLLDESIHHKGIVYSQKQHYQHVWDHIEIISQPQKQQIQQKYKFLKKIMVLTTTATIMESESQWSLIKKIIFGFSYPRYFVDYNTARLRTFSFFKSPTINLAEKIWNIPENGFSKKVMKLTFQNIAFHQKIYVPFRELKDDEFPDIYEPSQDSIKVRILYYDHLDMKDKVSKTCCNWNIFKNKSRQHKIDTILIHMHGGGFIALSSRMMQSMTRRWANELKIPIFSIDYRKPPNHPFPAATNDCLTVYKFLLKKISYYMDIEPTNIYLAGDSAGGNLACSLMGSILINKLQIPKGIYLAYPTIDIRKKFTPSKIHSLMDPLLWPTMLYMILKEYLGNDLSLQQHPLASPLLLTEAYIGGQSKDKRFPLKWPKTFISVGQKDTFYDDSLVLMQKLNQSNIQCYCRVYSQFRHGYLSTMMMMKQCYPALQDSVKDLKKLINFDQKERK